MTRKGSWLERMSLIATEWTGSSLAFGLALGTIIVWALTGPLFHYSDTWQLVINTGTTIVTFLMVFLIQRAQNKDSAAIHLKLNELIAAIPGSSNRLISAEDLSEHEVTILRSLFRKLERRAMRDEDFSSAHTVEEAKADQERKQSARAARKREKRALSKGPQAKPAKETPAAQNDPPPISEPT